MGPITVNKSSISLDGPPILAVNKLFPYEWDNSDCYEAHDNFKGKIIQKKGLHILHLNTDNLLINKAGFIAKQSNTSIIGINESKLDSSILNSELDIEDYDLNSLDRSRTRGLVAYYIGKSLSYNHKLSFPRNIENIFIDIFFLDQNQFW